MGKTISEKILAKASGQRQLSPGDIIRARPQFATSNDCNTPHWALLLQRIGVKALFDPERVVIVIDHCYPAPDTKWAGMHKTLRDWVGTHRVKYLYSGIGISHQIMGEKGHALPGNFLASDDFHCTNLGALGCFSAGIGSSIIEAYACGDVWMRVPYSIKIELDGKLPAGTTVRDISQRVLGDIGDGGAHYGVIEYSGPAVEEMTIDQRNSLCNRVVYTGAKTAIVNPDQKTLAYIQSRAQDSFDPLCSDPDANYQHVMQYDVSRFVPIVAVPHHPLLNKTVNEVGEVKIDQAYIGTCSGGRFDELKEVAALLRGKHISPEVRFIINPPSKEILSRLAEEGILAILLDAGATLETPGCGACFGSHSGVLADDEVCISTGPNNTLGRMGSRKAMIYLASPLTVAASALYGRITDPRELL